MKLQVASNCWVCEGWTQMEFRTAAKERPSLHLSCSQFAPQKMEKDQARGPEAYVLYRMVPPGGLTFFFSTGATTFTDPSQKAMPNANPQVNTGEATITVPKINYVENTDSFERLLSVDDLRALKAVPRPEPPQEELVLRPKSPWTLPKSLFAGYKFDTEEHLALCFDFDWRCSKIERLIKAVKDKERIYAYLKKNYRAM